MIAGARRDELDGVADGRLRIRLVAPPVEGKANKALVRFVAEALGVPRADIALVAGVRSRRKLLRVAGVTPSEARRRLGL